MSSEDNEKDYDRLLMYFYGNIMRNDSLHILKVLLNNPHIQHFDLQKKTSLNELRFFSCLQDLRTHQIIKGDPQYYKTTYYELSPFSKHILSLSNELLDRIEEEKMLSFKGK